MKKNLFLKLASGLLVLCLASTCAIGTTFAKYVTGDSASDTARVAKWGITVSTSGTLFGTDYAKNGETNSDEIIALNSSTNVSAFEGSDIDIVAPGTKNDTGFMVTISGTPEVEYDVTSSNTDAIEDIYLKAGAYGVMVKQLGLNADSTVVGLYTESAGTYTQVTTGTWASGTDYYKLMDKIDFTSGSDYYPIQWKVVQKGGIFAEGTTDFSTTPAAALAAVGTTSDIKVIADAMVTALNDTLVNGKENEPINLSYTLTWEWAFNMDADTNAKDTILGNLIANASNVVVLDSGVYKTLTVSNNQATVGTTVYANLDITFDMTVGVTQVD